MMNMLTILIIVIITLFLSGIIIIREKICKQYVGHKYILDKKYNKKYLSVFEHELEESMFNLDYQKTKYKLLIIIGTIVFMSSIMLPVFFVVFAYKYWYIFLVLFILGFMIFVRAYYRYNLYKVKLLKFFINVIFDTINKNNSGMITFYLDENKDLEEGKRLKQLYKTIFKNEWILCPNKINISNGKQQFLLLPIYMKRGCGKNSITFFGGLCSCLEKDTLYQVIIKRKKQSIKENINDLEEESIDINDYFYFQSKDDKGYLSVSKELEQCLITFIKKCNIDFEICIEDNKVFFRFFYEPFNNINILKKQCIEEQINKECYILDSITNLIYDVSNFDKI